MFCGRKSNNRINHLHERTLLKIYLAKIAQCLSSIEIFPHLQLKYAKLRIICQLRSQTDFSLHSVNTIAYGLKSLKYFAGKVWSIVAFEIRNAISLKEFSDKMKSWRPENCPCGVCLTYIHQVGYI